MLKEFVENTQPLYLARFFADVESNQVSFDALAACLDEVDRHAYDTHLRELEAILVSNIAVLHIKQISSQSLLRQDSMEEDDQSWEIPIEPQPIPIDIWASGLGKRIIVFFEI